MEETYIEQTTKPKGNNLTVDKDQTKKRITIWFLELQCQALLLSVLCIILSLPKGPREEGIFRDLVLGFNFVSTLFYSTGYLLTTAILAVFWRGQRLWFYPVIAATLFSIHLQILFFALGDVPSSEKLPVRLAGPCIVIASTLVGGYFLRRWDRTGSKLTNVSSAV
jgi:hypothetical protein